MDLSLVLACYREEGHLLRNVQAMHRYLTGTSLTYEIIFVEDKSPDSTLQEVEKSRTWLAERNVPAPAIYHEQNAGRGKTVQDGMMIAKGAVVAYLDVDLENLIDGLLPMYLKVRLDQADVVVGKRHYQERKVRPMRWILSVGYKILVHRILELPVSDTETGFKVFDREKILPVLPTMEDRAWFWDTEIVVRSADAGLRVAEHPIIFLHDPAKASTVSAFSDSVKYLKALWRFAKARQVRLAAGSGFRASNGPNFTAR